MGRSSEQGQTTGEAPAAGPGHRLLLVVNEHSARADADLKRGIEALRGCGLEVETEHPATIEASRATLSTARDRGASCILVAGGDGTLNQLVDALLETRLPIGLVPLGTANVLARTLGLPLDPEQACRVAATGRIRWIDVGRVNGHPFLTVASLGLSSRVARDSTPERKRQLGPFSYVLAAASAAFSADPIEVDLELPERSLHLRAIQIDVANSHHLGHHGIEADAEPDDGLLTVTALRARSRWALVLELWRFWRRRVRQSGESLIHRATRVEVRSKRPLAIDADGEPAGSTPAVFEIHPRTLPVVVPASDPRSEAG
ncbi:MAG TPA: YegS/Rv2252/BmrU family lipid kinase [Myxococcota bacterium]|nr:YegS/Rv2252/BmrU family lipid kinase [Myxococcota bacterium]